MAKMHSFERIKKQFNVEALIKSILFGLSFGVFLTGILLLILKLCGVSLFFVYYLCVGIGSALLAFGACFLLFYRGERALARRLDEKLGLPEKVQTAVAFQRETGVMVELQRADTEKVLSQARWKKPFFKRFWTCMLAVSLAIIMMITAVIVPMKKQKEHVTPPPILQGFTLTQWQLNALTELKNDVSSSKMETKAKETSVDAIENLITVLPEVTLRKDMVVFVSAAILCVDAAVEEINSYKKICVALFYNTESQPLKKFAKIISSLSASGYAEQFATLKEESFGSSGQEVADKIAVFKQDAIENLSNLGVATDDSLLIAVQTFVSALSDLQEELIGQTYDETQTQEKLTRVFEKNTTAITETLTQQYENKATRDHVKTRLIEIFQLVDSEVPVLAGDYMPNLEDGSGSGQEGGQGSGGYGEGEENYAGNDLIYDPYGENGGGYGPYGDSWDFYYGNISALLLEGNLSPELVKYINDYFLRLSPDSDGDNDN